MWSLVKHAPVDLVSSLEVNACSFNTMVVLKNQVEQIGGLFEKENVKCCNQNTVVVKKKDKPLKRTRQGLQI